MIKFITSFISLLWILLVGNPQPKNSLHKQPTHEDFRHDLDCWIQRNFYIVALAVAITLVLGIIVLMFWMYGMSTVESGTVYNHLSDVI